MQSLKQNRIGTMVLFLLFTGSLSGQAWRHCSPSGGFDVNTVYITAPGHIIVGGGNQSNDSIQIILKTQNYGLSWVENAYDGLAPWNKSMAFADTLNGVGVGDDGRIIKSDDGGLNWGWVVSTINRDFNKIVNTDSLTYYAAGGNQTGDSVQTVIKTTDAGVTWQVMLDRSGPWLKGLFFIDNLSGFAVGDSGVILRTINGGLSWDSVVAPLQRDFNAVTFISADTGFIIGGNSQRQTVLKTNDGGANWLIVMDTTGAMLNDISFADTLTGYAVGNSATVLKTTDGGLHWLPDTLTGLINYVVTGNEEFRSVKFYDTNFGIIGGKEGKCFIYTGVSPQVVTLGSDVIDSTHAWVYGSINPRGHTFEYNFCYSTYPDFFAFNQTAVQQVNGNEFFPVTEGLSALESDRWYYYFMQAGGQTGDTLRFYTGSAPFVFKTDTAIAVSDSSVNLYGSINNSPDSALIYFQFGLTPLLDSQVTATPASINDTLLYSVSVLLNGLQPGTPYYYRLKAVTPSGNYYGNTKLFFTGKPYTVFETKNVIITSDTTVLFEGAMRGFQVAARIYFEYGTSLAMDSQTSVYNYTDSTQYSVWGAAYGIQPHSLYYYRVKAETMYGTYYGDILTFYTGNVNSGFRTLPASQVNLTGAQLNGLADKLLQPANLSFEYGTSLALGNVVAASPAVVSDSLPHPVSAFISGLLPNTVYFYRIKGAAAGTDFFGQTKQLYTAVCEIPNCDFEIWDTLTKEKPVDWSVQGDIHRVPSYNGSNAVEFRGGGSYHLGVTISGIPTGNNFGGFPVNGRPDSIKFYARYDIFPGDTGYAAVYFTLQGNEIHHQWFPITGNTGGNFTLTKFKINFPTADVPDTVSVIFMSSNGFAPDPPSVSNPNSILAVDDVSFTGANIVVPNGNFEQWGYLSIDRPQSWQNNPDNELIATSVFDPIVKSTDAPSGNYALRLDNNPVLSRKPGFLWSGEQKRAELPAIAVGAKHQTLNGFVKYFPQNGDSLSISTYMFFHGVNIGGGKLLLTSPVTSYTPFTVDIFYLNPNSTDVPDSAVVSFELGAIVPHGNSVAYIDKIAFDGFGVITNNARPEFINEMLCTIYPSPAQTILTVEFEQPTAETTSLQLFNAAGVLVAHTSDASGQTRYTLPVAALPDGIYVLRVTTGQAVINRKVSILR